MCKLLKAAMLASLLMCVVAANAEPLGDCGSESQAGSRASTVMCEPWETESWWNDHGYVASGTLDSGPVLEEQMTYADIVQTDCISGNCLRLDTPVGVTRSLSIHWPLGNAGLAPEELYFRYYFKIGAAWTPNMCDASGNTVWPPSGKFPGLADVRGSSDAVGQCGNGGAASDGINCWSARGVFHGCEDGYSTNGFPYESTCESTPNAATRIGSYMYVPDNGTSHGANALWDSVAERNTLGDDYSSSCRRDDPDNPDPACYCNSTNNMYCGLGSGGQLEREKWYAIEMYVKMNTPGVADGVLRGWVNDKLSYEKTNVLYREPGHDNLHVRTIWLNTYKGGVDGNCENSALYYDQMVVSTERIGAMDIGPRPRAPEELTADP